MAQDRDDLLLPTTAQARRIRAGILSPVALVEASLTRIEQLNPDLNAFCAVYYDEALALARDCEAAVRVGRRLGLLHVLAGRH